MHGLLQSSCIHKRKEWTVAPCIFWPSSLPSRFHAFLLFMGHPAHAIRDVNIHKFCKIISEFALEYRTTRERVLQQKQKRANHRERNKTRGKMITDVSKITICVASGCDADPQIFTLSELLILITGGPWNLLVSVDALFSFTKCLRQRAARTWKIRRSQDLSPKCCRGENLWWRGWMEWHFLGFHHDCEKSRGSSDAKQSSFQIRKNLRLFSILSGVGWWPGLEHKVGISATLQLK